MTPLARFRSVTKRFGNILAVDDVSLDIASGEFFALLGPSGCGKTTLMRMMAGFETPDAGDILLDGASLRGVPPHRRRVNMMFQSYALFPHLNVAENVAYGLRQEGISRAEIVARVAEGLALVKLDGFDRRRPDQLSGGQQQRVALARVLVKRPALLMLDEPFAALDRRLREETRFELKELQAKLGLAVLLVTHDQEEAMAMAGRVAVMAEGRILQCGSSQEIYERPASRRVAEFVGDITVLSGPAAGGKGMIALRPERIALAREEPAQTAGKRAGIVRGVFFSGAGSLLHVDAGDGVMLKAYVANRVGTGRFAAGERVWAYWDADAAVRLPE